METKTSIELPDRLGSLTLPLVASFLLIAELEALLVTHYHTRTYLREMLSLPLYHIFLSIVGSMLVASLGGATLIPRATRLRLIPGGLHLALVLATFLVFDRFEKRLVENGTAPNLVMLLCPLLGLTLTWLWAWLDRTEAEKTYRRNPFLMPAILMLGVTTPYLAEFASGSWYGFGRVTFNFSEYLLSYFYNDIVADPNLFILGNFRFSVEIGAGCSGYEGIGLITAMVLVHLVVRRDHLKFPEALALIPLGALLIYIANIIRIVALIIVGTEISQGIALRGFHSQAGWLSFTLLGLAFIYAIERILIPPVRPPECRPTAHENVEWEFRAAPLVVPMLTLLIATMLVNAMTSKFQYAYPLKPLLGFAVLFYWKASYRLILTQPFRLLALGGGIAAYLLWLPLVRPGQSVSPFQALDPDIAYLWILARLVGSVLVVPAGEELAFRGFLLPYLMGPKPTRARRVLGVLIVSLIFAAMHQDYLAATLVSGLYCLVYLRCGLLNAILSHAVTNLLLSLQVLLLGDWWLW